ncbi:transferrin-binding protein-like solute binding protein [Sphingomonas sp.]|jgi:hypothetical protein|uniref:transferrin-binding protein-like solute binding protein n=1 Tax=Sphingomonas sp. TaxID=28214 RepID=UPI002E34C801|nr:transferrin-binding protein-like solute binding protein [Sphingomonas sp.]HEX4693314.1 transferrin-binding protein-like solute binding protein [Sphingomonas sp.]
MLNSLKLGRFERREATGRHSDIFFASGASTPTASIPTSGTAHYVGVIAGQYFPSEAGGTGFTYMYGVGGTVDLTVDFAAHSVTGSFHATARKSTDNNLVDMGVFPITGGTIDANGVIAATLATNPNSYYIYLRGGLSGRVYGATAGELGLQAAFRTCHYCFAGTLDSYDAFDAAGAASRR